MKYDGDQKDSKDPGNYTLKQLFSDYFLNTGTI